MRRRLILSLLVLALGTPVLAAEHGKTAEEDDKANGLYVDIAQVGLPVVRNGRLMNYVFVSARLLLTPNANVVALRAKEPYFRDALVRAGHRTPFTVPGQYARLDDAAIRRVMLVEATKIAGPRAISGIQVVKQTPQKVRGFPKD